MFETAATFLLGTFVEFVEFVVGVLDLAGVSVLTDAGLGVLASVLGVLTLVVADLVGVCLTTVLLATTSLLVDVLAKGAELFASTGSFGLTGCCFCSVFLSDGCETVLATGVLFKGSLFTEGLAGSALISALATTMLFFSSLLASLSSVLMEGSNFSSLSCSTIGRSCSTFLLSSCSGSTIELFKSSNGEAVATADVPALLWLTIDGDRHRSGVVEGECLSIDFIITGVLGVFGD